MYQKFVIGILLIASLFILTVSALPLFPDLKVTAAAFAETNEGLLLDVDSDAASLEATLQDLVAKQLGTVGVTYLNLETGEQISINGAETFLAASTQKLATHLMIADLIHEGQLTWDTLVAYEEARDYETGTGILQFEIEDGEARSIKELLELSIRYSDNIAHSMLASVVAADKAERYEKFFPVYLPEYESWDPGYLSSDQLAKLLEHLYANKSDVPEYETIFEFMGQSAYEERLLTPTTAGSVARTLGSYETNFHDIGIFTHPDGDYILAVTTSGLGEKKAQDFMSTLSDTVWGLAC